MSVFNTLLLASKIKPQPGGHDIYGTADPNATIKLNINASRYSDVGTQYTVTSDEYGNWGWDVPSGVTLTSLRYLLGTQYNNNPHIKTVYFDSGLDTQYLVSIDHLFTKSQGSSFDQGSQLTAVYGLSNIINASTNIEYLLSGCSSLTTIDDMDLWDFSAKTDLTGIFMNCSSLPINTTYASIIAEFDVSLATNLSFFFKNTELNNDALESLNWDTTRCTFFCGFLQNTNVTRFIGKDSSYIGDYPRNSISTGQATELSYFFSRTGIGTGSNPFVFINTGQCSKFVGMFDHTQFSSMYNGYWGTIDFNNATNTSDMYHSCTNLVYPQVPGETNETVTDASRMFYGCTSLGTNIDGTNSGSRSWVPRAIDLSEAFSWCTNIDYLDAFVTNNTLKNCTDASRMFMRCTSLNHLNLGGLDVSKVEDFSGMFRGCTSLWTTTNYFTNWNTSSGIDFSQMFCECTALGNPNGSNGVSCCLDGISNFNMSNAENVEAMFMRCPLYELKTDSGGFVSNPMTYIQDWDLSSCWNFSLMFAQCEGIEVAYLQRWNITNLNAPGAHMEYMFNGCHSLKEVYINNCDMTPFLQESYDWAWEDFLPRDHSLNVYYTTGLIPSFIQDSFPSNRVHFTDVLIDGSSSAWDKLVYLKIDGVTYHVEADSNGYWAIYDDGNVLPHGYVAHSFYGMLNDQVTNNNYVYVVSIKGLDINDVIDMSNMFSGNSGIAQIYFGYGDTSKVTSMAGMMKGTQQLSTFAGPRSTVSVTDMSEIFMNSSVSSLDLSSWYTPKLTNLSSAFGEAWVITNLVVPNFYDGRLTSVALQYAFPNRSNCYIYYDDYPTSTTRNMFPNSIWTQYQP